MKYCRGQFIISWSISSIILPPYQRDFDTGENPASGNSQPLKRPIFYGNNQQFFMQRQNFDTNL
jgi:hypothetical protein